MLLSGGVDSSVSLALLRSQGYDVVAFYLKIWLEDELSFLGQCPWEEDLKYARSVCNQWNVPLEVVPLQREYYEKVVSYTLEELRSGRTPSPDIFCNLRIKFGAFYDKIDNSFTKVASGHYAQIEDLQDHVLLKMCPDTIKDQTYFLSHLQQKQLQRIIFPIGEYTKVQVRELAQKYNLANKDRKDSQGICFLGKIKYNEFVKHHLGEKKGLILEKDTNRKLGEHRGYWYHTIGQREGLGLSGGPWYVVEKDIHNNIIYISRQFQRQDYAKDSFKVGNFTWCYQPPTNEMCQNLKIKIRHGPHIYPGKLNWIDNSNQQGEVILQSKDNGIAPGQFSVFYYDDICLGCAKIIG